MRAWIEQREGSSVLVRTGDALVTAVTPVSPQDIGFQGPDTLMVELHCLPQRRPRSIRVTVRAIVDADTDIAERARAAEGLETPVSWLIEWHRRADIPAHIPIEHLHLPTDATAVLVTLSRAESIAEQIDDVSLELS